jgi:uncharacterized protein with HEPN domain
MLNAIDTILERSKVLSFEDLTKDKIIFAGIVYYTMIIGEACYKLSPAFKEQHIQVNWRVIAGMRHHLVHGYYQVSPHDVWDVVQHDLAPLREQIAGLIATIDWDEWTAIENNSMDRPK